MEGNPAALQGATLPRCLSRLRAVALPPGPRGTAALLSLRVQRYWRLHRGCADRASNKHRSLASQIVSAAAFSSFKKDVRYCALCRCYGASGEGMAPSALFNGYRWSSPMSQHCHFDASRSLAALEQDNTIIAVIEMSQTKWLVAALIPGVERQPLKKFDAHEETLLKLLHRWRREAGQAGRNIKRIVVAFEAGRDGFWLARWLRARDIEVYVIHPTSIAVSREHRRAKTDRLDTELLMRVFLGWLRGERRHCSMVAIPTIEEEDARRPNRERQTLVTEQTRIINQMKAIFARFGIRTLRPTMRKVAEK